MIRRAFLRSLVCGVAGAVAASEFDLERLLWVPRQKVIFLPPPRAQNSFLPIQQVAQEQLRVLFHHLHRGSFKDIAKQPDFLGIDQSSIRSRVGNMMNEPMAQLGGCSA